MLDGSKELRQRMLDHQERISEVLFGLIMALTITNSLGIAEHSDSAVRTLLAGALGCNLAWGTIDAVMYLMAQFTERSRAVMILQSLRQPASTGEARRIIVESIPPILASILHEGDFDRMREALNQFPVPSPRLTRDDFLAAVGVFLLVFLSTLPVVFPFLFTSDAWTALRISNAIAIGMLFLSGYALGRHSGNNAWKVGLSMVAVGVVLVGVAVALGG
jgi:VIT1/CCC1 family predicted Fe2+/Mn2+ transporter